MQCLSAVAAPIKPAHELLERNRTMNALYSLKGWQLNAGASDILLQNAARLLGISLPPEYQNFIREHNGGEGFVGDNYLVLWKVEELHPFNIEYEVEQYAPKLLLFGSNGGGEAYGFDTRDLTMPIIMVPFIGMELIYARRVADNFSDFMVCLAH
jgi:SMI1 / KNR4 family (SUKH-1)